MNVVSEEFLELILLDVFRDKYIQAQNEYMIGTLAGSKNKYDFVTAIVDRKIDDLEKLDEISVVHEDPRGKAGNRLEKTNK
ncbi:MAG: hypothetical protein K6A90_11300 [Lachnospiraceae bacterium]|nr:hypothetical protein [Lachnospiraceae bacterium]